MISCPVQTAASMFANGDFILQENETLTFAGFEYNVRSACRILEAKGARRGEKIFIGVGKSWQSIALLFAAMRLGCVAIPIDWQLPERRRNALKLDFAVEHTIVADNWLLDFAMGGNTQVDEDVACLGVFTSGSNAAPKLVIHAYRSLLSNAAGANRLIPLGQKDRTLLSLPLYHIGGFSQVMRCLLSGTPLVIDGVVEDPEVLQKFEITHTSMVPTQLQRLVATQAELPRLKAVLVGGGPCAVELFQQAKRLNYPVWLTYGMTETASQLITESPEGHQSVIDGASIRLGESGEMMVQGENLFLGYWRRQGINSARDKQGWFHTRDLAQWVDGRYVLAGRADNQFISGGKNIQPEEIEAHLQTLENIDTVVVVPVAHLEFGFVPFAFVRLLTGAVDTRFINTTIDALKQELPGYLVPRHYAPLPREAGLKPKRAELMLLAEKILKGDDE